MALAITSSGFCSPWLASFHDGIDYRCAGAMQRDRDLDSPGQDVVARIAQFVVIEDVDGGHTDDANRTDQLDAAQCETLAEPLRSDGYGNDFMSGSEIKDDSVSQTSGPDFDQLELSPGGAT